MCTSCISSRTVWISLSGRKCRYLVHSRKGLEARLIPWQHYLAYNIGANVSRDSLGFVLRLFTETIYDVGCFKTKT